MSHPTQSLLEETAADTAGFRLGRLRDVVAMCPRCVSPYLSQSGEAASPGSGSVGLGLVLGAGQSGQSTRLRPQLNLVGLAGAQSGDVSQGFQWVLGFRVLGVLPALLHAPQEKSPLYAVAIVV